jgi:hypothetical protein
MTYNVLTLTNIPSTFSFKDDGHYGHEHIYWEAAPHLLHQKNTKTTDVLTTHFDATYKPVKVTQLTNGVLTDKTDLITGPNAMKVIFHMDPRYVVSQCKRIDVGRYKIADLNGPAYLTEETLLGDKVMCFESPFRFTSYLLMNKGSKWVSFDKQKWDYFLSESL